LKNIRNLVVIVPKGNRVSNYPTFRAHGKQEDGEVRAIGNLDILKQKKLALFCSVRCPGSIIIQAYDCVKVLRDAGITVISGFHSPVEKECLKILLRGKQPVIVCPARSLENMRLKPEFKEPLEDGRLLFLSPFQQNENRISAQRSDARNHFIATLADAVLIAYAAPGGKLVELFKEMLAFKKLTLALENEYNRHLAQTGVKWVNKPNIVDKTMTS
jgi:predicted Rossmann fold nucleotide-binding protein DprA/Smf involved in DNA uptake